MVKRYEFVYLTITLKRKNKKGSRKHENNYKKV